MKLIVIALAVMLSGCGGPYSKPGGSSETFNRDWYECRRDAAAIEDPFRRIDMQDTCIRSKGWTR